MLKNAKRFVETFNNYVSYAHTFSLTNNFRNSRKKGKKREKNLASEDCVSFSTVMDCQFNQNPAIHLLEFLVITCSINNKIKGITLLSRTEDNI